MQQYKDLVQDILENGIDSTDRTGTGTKSVFGRQLRFDLSKGFPLVTLKKTFWKGILVELLWLMRGETNIKFLTDRGVHIWNEWADKSGNLGPVYGEQWRKWATQYTTDHHLYVEGRTVTVDQLTEVIERIKVKPDCRRLIVSAWNAGEIQNMKLPPCHAFFQFYVREGKLSCQLYQRSADTFLGVPFNIASYALLTHLVANECGLKVGEFIHTFGDAHIYNNHIEQCKEMLKREPKELPQLNIHMEKDCLMSFVDDISPTLSWEEISEIIELTGYDSHPALKGEVSV